MKKNNIILIIILILNKTISTTSYSWLPKDSLRSPLLPQLHHRLDQMLT